MTRILVAAENKITPELEGTGIVDELIGCRKQEFLAAFYLLEGKYANQLS
ncbi:MAG TPA: hypothetical protein PLM20_04620 [Syntrophomonadaceae bacterium]|nr:hypothetical protein [Syntrophomonadaceae bacterium]HQA06940.1 hypothetical protein [Syntrophomonadaceae bacterium]HQE23167.1 hypothetical protein [Syntrophomonadaceae bacterium]